MKPSMLGLLIAAGAFAASTIYLSMQIRDERARTDQVLEQSRALNARIAELENAREELDSLRLTGATTSVEEPLVQAEPAALPSATDAPRPAAGAGSERFAPGSSPERSEAMKKMMRSQLRSNFKRQQADLGRQLGLSTGKANELIDLLVDQQMASVDRRQEERLARLSPEQRLAAWNEQQDKNLAEVAALIGADKVQSFTAYQESAPARQEVDTLSRQLEGNDLGLTPEQRAALVTALAEERTRVPAPKLADSASREEYTQVMSAWQQGYNERAAARASGILNKDQQAAYSEYQQWTTEMRQQFEARRAARGAQGGLPGPMPGAPPRQP